MTPKQFKKYNQITIATLKTYQEFYNIKLRTLTEEDDMHERYRYLSFCVDGLIPFIEETSERIDNEYRNN